jgi:hypothetical protein
VVRILYLCFGKSSGTRGAPVNRAKPLVDIATFNQLSKGTYDCGLVGFFHGEIGIVPPAEHSQSLEVFPLNINKSRSVFSASFSYFNERQGSSFITGFCHYLVLDGHAVTVPSRDIR